MEVVWDLPVDLVRHPTLRVVRQVGLDLPASAVEIHQVNLEDLVHLLEWDPQILPAAVLLLEVQVPLEVLVQHLEWDHRALVVPAHLALVHHQEWDHQVLLVAA